MPRACCEAACGRAAAACSGNALPCMGALRGPLPMAEACLGLDRLTSCQSPSSMETAAGAWAAWPEFGNPGSACCSWTLVQRDG